MPRDSKVLPVAEFLYQFLIFLNDGIVARKSELLYPSAAFKPAQTENRLECVLRNIHRYNEHIERHIGKKSEIDDRGYAQ